MRQQQSLTVIVYFGQLPTKTLRALGFKATATDTLLTHRYVDFVLEDDMFLFRTNINKRQTVDKALATIADAFPVIRKASATMGISVVPVLLEASSEQINTWATNLATQFNLKYLR